METGSSIPRVNAGVLALLSWGHISFSVSVSFISYLLLDRSITFPMSLLSTNANACPREGLNVSGDWESDISPLDRPFNSRLVVTKSI